MGNTDISRKQKKKVKKQEELEAKKAIEAEANRTELEKEALIKNNSLTYQHDVHVNAEAFSEVHDVEVPNSGNEEVVAEDKAEGKRDLTDTAIKENCEELKKEYDKERRLKYISLGIGSGLIIILIIVVYCKNLMIGEKDRIINVLNEQIATYGDQSVNLQGQISELNDKVQLLSETLTTKNSELEALKDSDRLLRIPSAYPLKGTAGIMSEEARKEAGITQDGTEQATDNTASANAVKKNVMFMCGNGTNVNSTGLGKVESITADSEYGYVIKINHDNGYCTYYHGNGEVLVAEGDLVTEGCLIMKIMQDNTIVLYEISYDDNFIDPMEIMEING